MSTATTAVPVERGRALPAILWGVVVGGILDITVAFIRWGNPPRILRGVAGGLLGPSAFQGGAATAALGLALHFSIALSAVAVYYAASRKIASLRQRAVVWDCSTASWSTL